MNERQIDLFIQFYEMLQELLVEIVEDRTTSPKILTKLAKLTDGSIVECVGMQPNTPSHIIEERIKQLCGVGGTTTNLGFIWSGTLRCVCRWCAD